ncbi:unnamed protein product [Periconia digitata]|uniref:Rhodopsin domain-containing protein n=1 Tax=Periconia digitata TaxID=1303443 RepID=A0A9W4UEK8_9PLEO|nr:unnamed protein product [Periconia digitata]
MTESSMDPELKAFGPTPLGVTPNFEHPASKKPMVIGLLVAIMPFTLLTFGLRVYGKAFVRKSFNASDWSCVAGAISLAGWTYVLLHMCAVPGMGNHQYELRLKDVPDIYFASLIAGGILFAVCQYFVKISLLLLITELFWPRKWIRYILFAATGATTLMYLIYVILSMFYCIPRSGETVIEASTGRCLTILPLSSVLGAFNVVSDIFILGISIPILMGLNTSLQRRLRASALFCLGLIATALSIASAYFRIKNDTTDGTWDYPTIVITGYYETSLGLICACVPTLPILGQSATGQRILNSRLFSLLTSKDTTQSRSKGSLPGGGFMRHQNNSSTTGLASQGIRVDTEFGIANTYELQEEQRKYGVR